jgi:DNA repair exonuclease SbcCD ATPase subunit
MGTANAERQRRYIQRLKAKAARASQATLDDTETTALRQELADANKRIAELEAKAKTKAKDKKSAIDSAREPTSDEARTIERLRKSLREARAELHTLRTWYRTSGLPERAGMSFATYTTIAKALHPDRSPTEAERGEAMRAFNAWKDALRRR